ncbi:MFS transporter [Photobacterium leiognathi]|uniref:MFS transporter n=1 Tax=Photobacterium leiognathi TaxID=553611 RepID=UPI002733205A|nr:MFS transporter [Photobacterium leiognathi]
MKFLLYNQKKIALFLIISISFLMGIAIDIYVPSLPEISSYYHTSIKFAELSISLYLLGYGLGQIVLGILSDTYGRKRIFIFSSLLFLVASVLCTTVNGVFEFNSLRFIQGVAIAGLASGMRAIIVDLFSGLELKKMANYFALSWALGPIVAPFIGANLSHYLGWKANFYLFSFYVIVILFVCTALFKESNKSLVPLKISHIKNSFVEMILHKTFLLLSIVYGLSYSSVLIFNTAGPYLLEVTMKYTILEYGYIAMLLGCGYFIGTIINRMLIVHYNNESILKLGVTLAIITALVMLVMVNFYHNLYVIIIPLLLMFLFVGLIVPNAIAITMTIFPEKAGFATSLCGTIVGIIVFAVTSLISGINMSSTTLALSYVAVFLIVYGLKMWVFASKNLAIKKC